MKSAALLTIILGAAVLLALFCIHQAAYEGLTGNEREGRNFRALKAKAKHDEEADAVDDNKGGSKGGHESPEEKKERDSPKAAAVKDNDGKDDHHLARRRSTSSHKKKHAQPIYDERGWHLEANDFVSKVLHPDELQPFFLQPAFFAVKLIVTMTIFGFSLEFSKPTHNRLTDSLAYIGQVCGGLAFILLALSGYVSDIRKFIQYNEHLSVGECIGTSLIIWCTSANYVACRAVWQTLLIENPVTLLGVIPKYPEIPFAHIPLYPGAAKWLDPLRHIYAKILLPYFLPYYVVNACQGLVILIWSCSTRCVLCCSSVQGMCKCSCALVGTILTLGLVAWSKDALSYWWGLEQPMYYYVLVQIWSSFISPIIFATIFGMLLCASQESIKKGLVKGFIHSSDRMSNPTAEPKAILEESDVNVLKQYNAELLVDFEAFDQIPGEDSGKEVRSDLIEASKQEAVVSEKPIPEGQREELDDSKIQIFVITLIKMSSIAFEQLLLIFLVRALNGPGDYNSYVGALKLTITERSWASYTSHLRSLAQAEAIQAGDYLAKVADAFNLLV